ncbi:DUF3883 domain-containing protein [Pseudomonas sp. LM20]|uniref:protein NO VEIN domain-containing protein n=1 Tax=Pseudomonas sp. LM20 TaxID=2899116 RepID=UPI001F18B322|nr:DUF3883 domain-containing protein [Pseudomonas sp. LM20]MCE5989547.1 DUF3883 domain-containing protein [Pseudomonas sp. LM20]
MPIKKPLLMFRVGYMLQYDGIAEIKGGGSHIEKHGEGGEMWNFRPESGRCYGYVMTRHFSGIDLSRIDGSKSWHVNEELEGVDIVFFAKKPDGGQTVIGWYKNATVFHKTYRKRRGLKTHGDWEKLDYLCEVDAEDAVLLDELDRTFEVPYAPVHGKGYPGHSNVWYGDAKEPRSQDFLKDLSNYIDQYSKAAGKSNGAGKSGSRSSQYDKDLIANIEKAAIRTTWDYYESLGYKLTSVEKDNRGWDLEALKGAELLRLEVKGHLGSVVQFELTPNEYMQMQGNASSYRVCMVRACLSTPELTILFPKKIGQDWMLETSDLKIRVQLSEKIAAKASEVI